MCREEEKARAEEEKLRTKRIPDAVVDAYEARDRERMNTMRQRLQVTVRQCSSLSVRPISSCFFAAVV